MIEPLCERTDLDHHHPDHDIIDKTIGPNPNRPKRNILIYADGQTVGLEKIIIITIYLIIPFRRFKRLSTWKTDFISTISISSFQGPFLSSLIPLVEVYCKRRMPKSSRVV